MTTTDPSAELRPAQPPPSLEDFVARARAFVEAEMPLATAASILEELRGDGTWSRALQAKLWDAGLAGICWPVDCGGLGLDPSYQRAFDRLVRRRLGPVAFNMTLGIIGPALVEFGTAEQRTRLVRPMLQGRAIWCQMLSEPTGGSDLAGVLTRARRDGELWRLSGAKTWTSHAYRADHGLCVARTDPTVPKHAGITVFAVDLRAPGIEVRRIRKADGDRTFCEVFADDVVLADQDVIGEPGRGWSVVTGLLVHEKSALGGTSNHLSANQYGARPASSPRHDDGLAGLARRTGRHHDPAVRQAVAHDHLQAQIGALTSQRIREAIAAGVLAGHAGAIAKLTTATTAMARATVRAELAGSALAASAEPADRATAEALLVRQGMALGGGSNEMQRNTIAERLLGMPRELGTDQGKPFDQVPHNTAPVRPAKSSAHPRQPGASA